MAGMFSAPCCLTCAHGVSLAQSVSAARDWGCQLHGRKLPTWTEQWGKQFPICQAFRYQGESRPGIAAEYVRLYYADPNILYCYPSEYHHAKYRSELAHIDELPSLEPRHA